MTVIRTLEDELYEIDDAVLQRYRIPDAVASQYLSRLRDSVRVKDSERVLKIDNAGNESGDDRISQDR
jgi:hypothetical protein